MSLIVVMFIPSVNPKFRGLGFRETGVTALRSGADYSLCYGMICYNSRAFFTNFTTKTI